MSVNKISENNDSSNPIPCPVCNKVFDKNTIEEHVNKCLFLNTQNEFQLKRSEISNIKRNSSHLKNHSSMEKRTRLSTSPSSSKGIKSQPETFSKTKDQSKDNKNVPLAERMRPVNLQDIIGHTEAFGSGSMLRSLLEQRKIPNMILWGPPGCGKTSLANVIANICKEQNNMRFVKLSATMSGINDVKEVVKVAKNEAQFKRQTVLFMDEIHRCRLWVKAVGIEDLTYLPIEKLHQLKYICGAHFSEESFHKKGNRLKQDAIPNINFLNMPLTDEILKEFPLHMKNVKKQYAPKYGPLTMCTNTIERRYNTSCPSTTVLSGKENFQEHRLQRHQNMKSTKECPINVPSGVDFQLCSGAVHFDTKTILLLCKSWSLDITFNKLQQDSFLPHVENGTIILVGATTENPSFSLNNALLSRCRVVVMEKLSIDDVLQILKNALERSGKAAIEGVYDLEQTSADDLPKCIVEEASLQWLAEVSDGDARVALGALEIALDARDLGADIHASGPAILTLEDIKNGIKRTHMMYDRQGEEHYNTVSAVHKSIRASDDNAALYWTTRALHGGEDPLYIARRLVRAACEDIGLADPNAIVEAVACLQGCQQIGMPECDVLLVQCAVRLARAPKSTEVYRAMKRCQASLAQAKGPLPPVPLYLRNAPTKLMKQLGYGSGYNLLHKDESGLQYMPEGMEDIDFFRDA